MTADVKDLTREELLQRAEVLREIIGEEEARDPADFGTVSVGEHQAMLAYMRSRLASIEEALH